LMNSMDFLPVDLIPLIWEMIYAAAGHDAHHAYMRVVPTADLSTTLGMSVFGVAGLPVLQRQDQGCGGLGT
jgi:F-type H+-transporting ATPase subunit a